jgi:glycosyltransferase involved in cell wall biosynthesis
VTLHLVALPHTRVTSEFVGCAYTAKALKFTKMMHGREDVILYAPEGSTDEFTAETVEVISDKTRQRIFGKDNPARLPAWPSEKQTDLFNRRATKELRKRWEPGDLVLLAGGWTHQPVVAKGPEGATYCEPGVGYEGILTPFCAFESHAWRHHVYAKQGIIDGRWFDATIPNYFDLDEFPILDSTPARDYLVFLGRIVPRKGPHVALEIANHAGLPLFVAGAGADEVTEGRIVAGKGTPDEVTLEGNVQHIGPVNAEQRNTLLAGARALVCPTIYIEPFGGVAVEAMLAGTPVIATDWGAFTETVEEGVTGFRFRTLREGVEAVERCAALHPKLVREAARVRYSLEAVAPQFTRWFDQLRSLQREGWYEMAAPPAMIRA